VGEKGLLHLTSHLKAAIKSLHWNPKGTEWADYYNETNYSGSSFAYKKRIVRLITSKEKPGVVWDLGANTGEFSQLAAEKAGLVIAFDVDPAAVEKHYRENRLPNVLPLLLDLTNPSPALGWKNQERKNLAERGPADMIIALALIHHLAISNNLPLLRIAEYFRENGRTLLIEFVPKTDSQVQKLLATRPDIFPEYDQVSFEAVFATVFTIENVYPITDSERILYFMRAK
jgi:ribosomal protein L11 methylase PrmA